MDKPTAIALLRSIILERFPAGPDRRRWLKWLTEFSHAEESFQTLFELQINLGDDESPHSH